MQETKGVCVAGYRANKFPDFFTQMSGYKVFWNAYFSTLFFHNSDFSVNFLPSNFYMHMSVMYFDFRSFVLSTTCINFLKIFHLVFCSS